MPTGCFFWDARDIKDLNRTTYEGFIIVVREYLKNGSGEEKAVAAKYLNMGAPEVQDGLEKLGFTHKKQ